MTDNKQPLKERQKALQSAVAEAFSQMGWHADCTCDEEKCQALNNIHRALYINSPYRLAYSEGEKVGYTPKPGAKRVQTTLSRFIRRRLKIPASLLDDKFIADLSARALAELRDPGDFITVVAGDAIVEKFVNEYGMHTCMTGDRAKDLVSMYGLNPKKISLVLFDDSNIRARAILWTTDQGPRVLDRIYPNSGQHIRLMLKWAHNNNIIVRKHQGAPNDAPTIEDKKFTITVKHAGTFPYLDTFNYGTVNEKESTAILCNRRQDNYRHTFGEQNGHYGGQRDAICGNCEEYGHISDMYVAGTGTSYCHTCYFELYERCGHCESEIPVDSDNATCVEDVGTVCHYCIEDYYFLCHSCEEHFATASEIRNWCSDSEKTYCDACVTDVAIYCDNCGEWHEQTEVRNDTDTGTTTCKEIRQTSQ